MGAVNGITAVDVGTDSVARCTDGGAGEVGEGGMLMRGRMSAEHMGGVDVVGIGAGTTGVVLGKA